MEIINLKYTETGDIDCEINHHIYGWIPFTASPNDHEPMGVDIFTRAVAGEFGDIPSYVIIDTPITVEDYESSVQFLLDSTARERGYDSILSATSYAGYVNPFQNEGIAFGEWRSSVWVYCHEQFLAVQNETRTAPTVEELLIEVNTNCILTLP